MESGYQSVAFLFKCFTWVQPETFVTDCAKLWVGGGIYGNAKYLYEASIICGVIVSLNTPKTPMIGVVSVLTSVGGISFNLSKLNLPLLSKNLILIWLSLRPSLYNSKWESLNSGNILVVVGTVPLPPEFKTLGLICIISLFNSN